MSKINLGLIGLGYISKEHIKVIKSIKDFKIYGIVTKTNKNSYAFAKKNGINKIYQNIDEMMNDIQIDAVVVMVQPYNSFKVLKKIIPYKKIFLPNIN